MLHCTCKPVKKINHDILVLVYNRKINYVDGQMLKGETKIPHGQYGS